MHDECVTCAKKCAVAMDANVLKLMLRLCKDVNIFMMEWNNFFVCDSSIIITLIPSNLHVYFVELHRVRAKRN